MGAQFFVHFDSLSTISSCFFEFMICVSRAGHLHFNSSITEGFFFPVTGKTLETCAAGSLSTPNRHYVFSFTLAVLMRTQWGCVKEQVDFKDSGHTVGTYVISTSW